MIGAVEDLGRELVRSLDAGQFAGALISPAPPSDIVGGNRSQVAPGDVPLALTEIWRDAPVEPAASRLAALQASLNAALGLRPEHLDALRLATSPAGVSAGVLGPAQQEVLRALVDTYLGRMPDDIAHAEAAKYAGAGLGSLHFGWAGGVEKGQPHYYRITGPRLLVEYDNTQNDVNHIHSVWRDPAGDFGMDVLGAHLRRAH